jgi:glycosyltransferase involved in cell wall biosynthesis
VISVIIPSYKDPLLHRTIDSLLDRSEGSIEIIPVLDGYNTELRKDPRVKPIHLKDNVGMREAINIGVLHANGEYIMRSDEHCRLGQGYDRILTETIEDNWIVTPRRYKLDVDTWECIERPIDHEKLVIAKNHNKFGAVNWRKRDRQRPRVMIDEKTAMQGSCWLMPIKWWHDVIGRLDSEGYGTHYQDVVEMLFKTWQAGGKLMLNKNTWYAHKHRKFNRTHNYPNRLARKSFDYALDKWGDYYRKVIIPKLKEWERNGINNNPRTQREILTKNNRERSLCC